MNLETKAILNVSPGFSTGLESSAKSSTDSASDTYAPNTPPDVRIQNTGTEKKQEIQSYDQTKLDSFSQLWGAGPLDLELGGDQSSDSDETIIPLDTLKMEGFSHFGVILPLQ